MAIVKATVWIYFAVYAGKCAIARQRCHMAGVESKKDIRLNCRTNMSWIL